MDTREQAGTFDLFVRGISQQSVTEDPLHVPAPIHIRMLTKRRCSLLEIL